MGWIFALQWTWAAADRQLWGKSQYAELRMKIVRPEWSREMEMVELGRGLLFDFDHRPRTRSRYRLLKTWKRSVAMGALYSTDDKNTPLSYGAILDGVGFYP